MFFFSFQGEPLLKLIFYVSSDSYQKELSACLTIRRCLAYSLVIHKVFVDVDSAFLFFLERPRPRLIVGTVAVLLDALLVRATDFCLVPSDFFLFFDVGLAGVFLLCFSDFDVILVMIPLCFPFVTSFLLFNEETSWF